MDFEAVTLSEEAFVTMIVAAAEVYKNEALGILLGYKAPQMTGGSSKIIVENAIAYQTAKRKPGAVEPPKPKRKGRMNNLTLVGSTLDIVGDFHSHPDTPPAPSKNDRDTQEEGEVGIIIGISEVERHRREWKMSNDFKELFGSACGLRFRIAAYYKGGEQGLKKLDIHCPYALGLGYFDLNPQG